jgi:hypothetical protein
MDQSTDANLERYYKKAERSQVDRLDLVFNSIRIGYDRHPQLV